MSKKMTLQSASATEKDSKRGSLEKREFVVDELSAILLGASPGSQAQSSSTKPIDFLVKDKNTGTVLWEMGNVIVTWFLATDQTGALVSTITMASTSVDHHFRPTGNAMVHVLSLTSSLGLLEDWIIGPSPTNCGGNLLFTASKSFNPNFYSLADSATVVYDPSTWTPC
jgi:hypothetical protein